MRARIVVAFLTLAAVGLAHAVPGPGESGGGAGASPAAAPAVAGWNSFLEIGSTLMPVALELAEQAYAQQDFKKAAPLYEVLHHTDPDNLTYRKRLGFALKEVGRYEEAHDLLFQASVEDPSDYLVWWWLSDTQRLLGDYKKSYESMVTSRDAAPEVEKQALQQYVDYTEILGTDVPSWTVFERHREFARRHERVGRLRRTIAEYMSALDTVPPTGPKADDAPLRVAWVNNQIGIQYNQLKEPEVALDYFWRALKAYGDVKSQSDVMMCYQNLGVTYRLLAENDAQRRGEFLELGAKYWGESLKLAESLKDVPYTRYARAGQLQCLVLARGVANDEVKALRAANKMELPWSGPISEYTTAAVAVAEMMCRMVEGDYAGARIAGEMGVEFFAQSGFLLDAESAVQIRLQLAQAFTRQGHFDEALKQADLAQEKLDVVRSYLDTDSFTRSANRENLRGIAVARVRAAVLKGDFAEAQRQADSYTLQARTDLLGSKVFDEAAKNDYVSERELLRRRLAALEADLAAAGSAGPAEAVARLTARVAADKARAEWLDKGVFFRAADAVNYRAVPVLGPLELAPSWPADTRLVTLLSDAYGTVTLVQDGKAAWGADLPEAREADLHALTQAVTAHALTDAPQAISALDTLGAKVLAPIKDKLTAKTLYFAVDGVLGQVPMELLRTDGAFLLAGHDVAYVPSASYLIHQREMPRVAGEQPRIACAGAGCEAWGNALPGAARCADEACVTAAEASTRLLLIAGEIDLNVSDEMLSAVTLEASKGEDGRLHAAELLGAQLRAEAAWFAPISVGTWSAGAWGAFEEALVQAGARAVVHPLLPVDEAAQATVLGAARGPLSVASFSEARRAALAADPAKLGPAFVCLFGVAE